MKKKILSVIFAICLIIPAIICLSACDKEKEKPYSIIYDYGEAKSIFSGAVDSASVKPNKYLTSMPTIKDEYASAFKGWFIVGTNKKIGLYDSINGDLTLEARFDVLSNFAPSGLYFNGKYVKTWNVLKTKYSAIGENTIQGGHIETTFNNLEGELVIDNSITCIDDYAFRNCMGLKSVLIPNSVTELGVSTFERCKNLEYIIIPNSVMVIPSGTLYGCTNLINITIEKKLGYKWQKSVYGTFTWVDVDLDVINLINLLNGSSGSVALKRVSR